MTQRHIDLVIHALHQLAQDTHRTGIDRCCIGTFNDKCETRELVCDTEELQNSFKRIYEPSGASKLYDSICDFADGFSRQGDESRPWLIIVVTSGNDDRSTRSAEECGRYINQTYNKRQNSFIFVVSIGNRVNDDAISNLTRWGNIVHVPVRSSFSLGDVLSKIILQVTMDKKRSIAIDYGILVDTSVAMAELATARCFANHQLLSHWYGASWWCSVCGADNESALSQNHCSICNFDACASHCIIDDVVQPICACRNNHAMQYSATGQIWKCRVCKKRYPNYRHLRCNNCNYDICDSCVKR